MNIAEAVAFGLKGEKIRDGDNGEWILVCSSGSVLRYQSNRQLVTLNVPNILSKNWQSDLDFLIISRSNLSQVLEEGGVDEEKALKIIASLADYRENSSVFSRFTDNKNR